MGNSTMKVVVTWYWDQQLESSPRLHTAACTSIAPVTRRGASHGYTVIYGAVAVNRFTKYC